MCRVASQEFGGTIAAVAEARGFVTQQLRRWGLESLASDAELLTSELVTNAVLHARGDVITVIVAVAEGVAEIGVSDRSSDLPEQRSRTWRAEGGRGLRLVDLVALEWGVVPVAGGKQVWFRLDVDSSWPHRTDCPCGGDDLERVRLESGRYAVAAHGPWDDS
jgi:anti-sigma regulatory factor (Ser/Thr protein kinase)